MRLVSVVVATYRRDAELRAALESLAQQTCLDFEIVLVDDNGCEEWNAKVSGIVANFREQHPTVAFKYIVNSPNQGSAKTRNIGIESSEAEFVTFLDDDDVYLPEKLSKQVEFMKLQECDYSVTDLFLYSESDKLIDKRVRNYITDTSPEALLEYHLKYHITGTDTMMFRKEYLVKIGGFAPINVGDEFYLMQRAIEGGGKFGYLPGCEIKAYVHTGEGGLSSGDGKIKGENDLYEYKNTFFGRLKSKDVRYIKMRHYAVIAFANIRMKKYFKFLLLGFKSFLCSPVQCITLVLKRNGN